MYPVVVMSMCFSCDDTEVYPCDVVVLLSVFCDVTVMSLCIPVMFYCDVIAFMISII